MRIIILATGEPSPPSAAQRLANASLCSLQCWLTHISAMRCFFRPVLVVLALVMTATVATESNDNAFLQLEADAARVEEVFEYRGDSHYEFGLRMGEQFRYKIQQRFVRNAKLQTLLLPYVRTADGLALYTKYIDSHSRTFPVGC